MPPLTGPVVRRAILATLRAQWMSWGEVITQLVQREVLAAAGPEGGVDADDLQWAAVARREGVRLGEIEERHLPRWPYHEVRLTAKGQESAARAQAEVA